MTASKISTLPYRRSFKRRLRCVAAIVLSGAIGGVAAAQDAAPSTEITVPSPILTLDPDRLFRASAWGQRVRAELLREIEALRTENAAIAAELEAEEQRLTELRVETDPAVFREMAQDFDARATRLRAEQDAKEASVLRRLEETPQRFLNASVAILSAILNERGAVMILERRYVFLAPDAIDITDLAIARINAELGDGSQ